MNTRRGEAGLSMLEIVMTTFLVMMALVVVVTSFLAIAKADRYSERMETANTLARLEMERLRNQPYANIQSEVGLDNEYAPDHPGFRHEVTVNDLGTVKEITLWIYFEQNRRRAEFRTYVSNL